MSVLTEFAQCGAAQRRKTCKKQDFVRFDSALSPAKHAERYQNIPVRTSLTIQHSGNIRVIQIAKTCDLAQAAPTSFMGFVYSCQVA